MNYYGCWSDVNGVLNDFAIDSSELKGCRVLIAWYGQEPYEGAAFVLYSRGKKLYEVNGGHCSCYGLEGQWSPEETTVEALRHRLDHGYCFSYDDDRQEASKALDKVLKRRETR